MPAIVTSFLWTLPILAYITSPFIISLKKLSICCFILSLFRVNPLIIILSFLSLLSCNSIVLLILSTSAFSWLSELLLTSLSTLPSTSPMFYSMILLLFWSSLSLVWVILSSRCLILSNISFLLSSHQISFSVIYFTFFLLHRKIVLPYFTTQALNFFNKTC